MRNRGNGKGGGIAAVGLVPEQIGVSREVLDSHYLLQIALLDPACHAELERRFILHTLTLPLPADRRIDDHRDIPGLEVSPPDVHRYVVRVKPDVLKAFAATAELEGLAPRELEDRVCLAQFLLCSTMRSTLRWARSGFRLSHGRDLLVFKLVGYAEQNVE
jgi:hypothetical protein